MSDLNTTQHYSTLLNTSEELYDAYHFIVSNDFMGGDFYLKKTDMASVVDYVLRSPLHGSYEEKLDTLTNVLLHTLNDFDTYFKYDVNYLHDTYNSINDMRVSAFRNYLLDPKLASVLGDTLDTVKDTFATFLAEFIPGGMLADAFIELVDSENGSWEYAQVTEHNLMTCEDWEQADK